MVRKEMIQMMRDWPTLVMMILIPVIELFFFAYVGDMQLTHMPTVLADMSRDPRSRAFVNALVISEYYDITMNASSEAEVIAAIDGGDAVVGIIIPPAFAGNIERGYAQVLILIDGSDTFVIQSAYLSAVSIGQAHGMEIMLESMERKGFTSFAGLPIDTATRILYNPNMDDLVFLIPGLSAMLLQIIAVNATAMSVVKEQELGTLEQLLVTPVRPLELILGKLVPPVLLTGLDLFIIIGLGIYYFKVPFQGSIPLFLALSLVFIVSGLGLGLLMSTTSKSQTQAQHKTAALMILSMLLTGLVYPRSTMPQIIQWVGDLIPATYFVRIARGIVTKGVGLEFLWRDVAVLGIYSLVVIVWASRKFKQRLD